MLRPLGATVRDMPAIEVVRHVTIGEVIDGFEAGLWSRHWRMADDARAHAAAQIRTIARAEGVDLAASHRRAGRIDLIAAVV